MHLPAGGPRARDGELQFRSREINSNLGYPGGLGQQANRRVDTPVASSAGGS